MNKNIILVVVGVVAIGGAAYFFMGDDTPASAPTNSRQTTGSGDEEDSYQAGTDIDSLRDDLPLYPGVSHQPTPVIAEGYYRWNFEAPESDMATIASTIKDVASDKGWEMTNELAGDVSHELAFSKEADVISIVIRADGDDQRPVYYEFMTAEFVRQNL